MPVPVRKSSFSLPPPPTPSSEEASGPALSLGKAGAGAPALGFIINPFLPANFLRPHSLPPRWEPEVDSRGRAASAHTSYIKTYIVKAKNTHHRPVQCWLSCSQASLQALSPALGKPCVDSTGQGGSQEVPASPVT